MDDQKNLCSGYYYQHPLGVLVFKSSLSEIPQEAEKIWVIDFRAKHKVWQFLIEARSLELDIELLDELEKLWEFTEDEAKELALKLQIGASDNQYKKALYAEAKNLSKLIASYDFT